jgi:hypothetical protein
MERLLEAVAGLEQRYEQSNEKPSGADELGNRIVEN